MHMQVVNITFITQFETHSFFYAGCHCYLHHSTQDLFPSKSFLLFNFRLSLSLCNRLRHSIPNLLFMSKLTLSFSCKPFFSLYRLPSLQFQTSLYLCRSPSSFNSKPCFSQLSSLFNSKPFFFQSCSLFNSEPSFPPSCSIQNLFFFSLCASCLHRLILNLLSFFQSPLSLNSRPFFLNCLCYLVPNPFSLYLC